MILVKDTFAKDVKNENSNVTVYNFRACLSGDVMGSSSPTYEVFNNYYLGC